MGRDRKNERATEHFTKMIRATMETPAWRALSTTAQALYPWLKLEWGGLQNNNNGKISLSVRQAAIRLNVQLNTATRAFHDLQAKGFLVITEYGTLGSSGQAKAHCYEITELPLPHTQGDAGRRWYRDWKEGKDFPVHTMRANNPRGLNGKSKTLLKNDEGVVVDIATFQTRQTSQ